MKKLSLIAIATVLGCFIGHSEAAILMAHFGSSHDDARAVTSDVVNADVAKAFPTARVVEAYTSPRVIKALASRGQQYDTPRQALERLAAAGVDSVVVQPTFVIPGVEYDLLKADVDAYRASFKSIVVGTPLLYSVEECRRVADVLGARHAEADMKHHVVFVAHGSPSLYGSLYCQLENMFHAAGHLNFHVATIEGYPSKESVLAILKRMKARDVTLVPLLFLAGEHAATDIEGEWVGDFTKQDLVTNTWIEGLGEIAEIRALYVEHVARAMADR